MSKKKEIPEEAGKVNWDKLETFSKKGNSQKKKKKAVNNSDLVKKAVNKLSDADKASPYPDDFLADINLMRGQIDGSGLDLSDLEDDDDADKA